MKAWPFVLVLSAAACGSTPQEPTLPEPPPRDLGPIEIGPIAPEARHLEAETYTIDVEGPPVAAVKEKVVTTVTLKAKGDLSVQGPTEWKIEPIGPRDCDFIGLAPTKLPPASLKGTVQVTVTVVPLRAGLKHVAFQVKGSVCNADFCDVVAETVSLNLDVK